MTDSLRASRAGDRFHYLWAARRCLVMLQPSTALRAVYVECSPEPTAAGERVIDVAEEWDTGSNGHVIFKHFQLKHSVNRIGSPAPFSEVAPTIKQFAQRFREPLQSQQGTIERRTFAYVSNRTVSSDVKTAFEAIANGSGISQKWRDKIIKAIHLDGEHLTNFCRCLSFEDGECGFVVQLRELEVEVSRYGSGHLCEGVTGQLLILVSDHALPVPPGEAPKGKIVKEDILKRFGVSDGRDLFPACSAMKAVPGEFRRLQHDDLRRSIIEAKGHLIIEAPGGTGKSVAARLLAESFTKDSVALVYDCFGNGNYLNQSMPRHRACDGFVQISNELACRGFCRLLLRDVRTPTDLILRGFLDRLQEACQILQTHGDHALLVIFIDAADNAELAAERFDPGRCFVSSLLSVCLPTNCRIVYLCRPERTHLLKANQNIPRVTLLSFSLEETKRYLRSTHPDAHDEDAIVFHALTAGNPRVQSYCLEQAALTVSERLASLGPGGMTVESQIANQLAKAVERLQEDSLGITRRQINSICIGLASLPPFIPIAVLAAAAGVPESSIESFIGDLGKGLLLLKGAVQFQDEPCEHWFTEKFAAQAQTLHSYAQTMELLAGRFTYAARALPYLWFRAGEHERLIQLALSDDHLPENNPMDARSVRVNRLQFGLRTAIQQKSWTQAAQLALRAGEEMAGSTRQNRLLRENPDLMGTLQEPHRVQECAFKGQLEEGWKGSSNLYAASLLCVNPAFRGEARHYYEAARYWLLSSLEDFFAMPEDKRSHHDPFNVPQYGELGWVRFVLDGPNEYVRYLSRWSIKPLRFDVTEIVARRLVDAGRWDDLDELARQASRSPHMILPVCHELSKVGRIPPGDCLPRALARVAKALPNLQRHSRKQLVDDPMGIPLAAFAEACASHHLNPNQICMILERISGTVPSIHRLASDYDETTRHSFARAVTLKAVLSGSPQPIAAEFFPTQDVSTTRSDYDAECERNAEKMLSALLPLYFARARILLKDEGWQEISVAQLKQPGGPSDYGAHRSINLFWDELNTIYLNLLALLGRATEEDLKLFQDSLDPEFNKYHKISRRIEMISLAYRHPHLTAFAEKLEGPTARRVRSFKSEEPEQRAAWRVDLARAVLSASKADAAAYFDEAIEVMSKFGDEMVDRWEALCSIARRRGVIAEGEEGLVYRFIRCAELIGESVSREKYWRRSEVMVIAAGMHLPSTFAAMSRWRERRLGWDANQLEALAVYLTEQKLLQPASAYSLTGFDGPRCSLELLNACLVLSKSATSSQVMFDQCVADLYLDGNLESRLPNMQSIANRFSLQKNTLHRFLSQEQARKPLQVLPAEAEPVISFPQQADDREWLQAVFQEHNVSTPEGIVAIVEAFHALPHWQNYNALVSEMTRLVPRGSEMQHLQALLEVRKIPRYDFIDHLVCARQSWMERSSVQRNWKGYLKTLGKRRYAALAYRQTLGYWQERCEFSEIEVAWIQEGVEEGIVTADDSFDCGALFGLVDYITKKLSPMEAGKVLDYAIGRFEEYVEPDFGDGPWLEWLYPPSHEDAFSGFLWAALATPETSSRWQAAHCVRRLVELGCAGPIASLVNCWKGRNTSPFLGKDFFFYEYHARMFLLLGLDRAALDRPEALLMHASFFCDVALLGTPHALIQPTAAHIALGIEKRFPHTLSQDNISSLRQVGRSIFKPMSIGRDYVASLPDFPSNAPEAGKQLYLAYDFDRYWLPSLSDAFAIDNDHLEGLLREAAISHLGITRDEDYPTDHRNSVFRSINSGSFYGTFHSHSSYPRIDSLHFYYSFHAMLIAGAGLLGVLPLVTKEDELSGDDPYEYWLKRHSLTRPDKRWLSDRRDPTLPSRIGTRSYEDPGDWRWRIKAGDFFELMVAQSTLPNSLCVAGDWNDSQSGNVEDVTIECVLVRPEMASSLANAIRSSGNYYTCGIKTISLGRNDATPLTEPFDLVYCVLDHISSDSSGIDTLDSCSHGLRYPGLKIADWVKNDFNLQCDADERYWTSLTDATPQIVSESWCDPVTRDEQQGRRSGTRLLVSVPFLKQICDRAKRDLLITVAIHRKARHSSNDDGIDQWSIPASQKVFILSSDGHLRDEKTDYQIG
jgi:hypothetical protein